MAAPTKAARLDPTENYAFVPGNGKTCEGVIEIGQPRIVTADGKSRLQADVMRPGWDAPKPLWMEVDSQYGKYLCDDRSDAFVAALLGYAMRHSYDIHCKAPVTGEMLDNLQGVYIPALVKASKSKRMYATEIVASVCEDKVGAQGVGTAISCGIDSLYSVFSHIPHGGGGVTHLLLNRVGAYREGSDQFAWQRENAARFCADVKLPLVCVDSNITDVFHYNQYHFRTQHDYVNYFCVLGLRNLFKTYYSASDSNTLYEFSVKDVDDQDCGYFAPFTCESFSTRGLRLYSSGMEKSRFEKTELVAKQPLAWKYLHVCTDDSGPNCGKCGKCRRTLTTLDAIGMLEKFSGVFDVGYYRQNRLWYLKQMYRMSIQSKSEKVYLDGTFERLCHDIPPVERLKMNVRKRLGVVFKIPGMSWLYTRIVGAGGLSDVKYAPKVDNHVR